MLFTQDMFRVRKDTSLTWKTESGVWKDDQIKMFSGTHNEHDQTVTFTAGENDVSIGGISRRIVPVDHAFATNKDEDYIRDTEFEVGTDINLLKERNEQLKGYLGDDDEDEDVLYVSESHAPPTVADPKPSTGVPGPTPKVEDEGTPDEHTKDAI